MSLDLDPNHIFRDFVIDGMPASGANDPRKVEIRQHLSSIWRAVIALLADANPGLTLPNLLIRYTVTGGTANAIEATPNLAPPSGPGLALFSVLITTTNTGPVTINGKPLLTSSGNQIADGGLVPGVWLFLDDGENFRLVSDQASQTIMAAVEAALLAAQVARDDAETARDEAANYANDALAGGMDPGISATLAVPGLHIPVGITHFRTGGYAAPGDGGAALYWRVSLEPSHDSKVQSADGAWWEEVAREGTLLWYSSMRVPLSQAVVHVTGGVIPGDGGEGRYMHAETEPPHAAKFQDAGGRWFEFVDRKIRVQHIQATAGLSGFDVTEAVQKALDYLEARGGGELSIIPGTYDVSDIIRIPSKVKIVGEDGAIINRAANTNSVLINKSDGSLGGYGASRNISISGVTIECNGATYTTPCTPVAFGHARKVSVKNITVRDVPGGWHAIELCAVSGAKIKGVTLDGGGNDLDTGEAIQLDIMGSEFGFPWFGPYDHMWCEDVVIEDVTITNWAVGIGSHSVSSTPGGRHTNVKIRDCRLSVSRHGITPYGWTRVTIRDNIITNYMRADTTAGKSSIGINVTSTANNNCTAIRIRDNIIDGFERGGAAENSRGINVAGPSAGAYTRQVSISGNFISNVKRHGIGVDYAQDVLVFGNRLEGIGQVGIYMFGSTKSSVRDNRVISGGAGYDDIIVNHGALPVGTLLDVIVAGNYCPRKMTANGTRIIVVDNIVGVTTGSIDGSIVNGTKAGNLVNGAWV